MGSFFIFQKLQNGNAIRLSADTTTLTYSLNHIATLRSVVFQEEYYEAHPHERYQSGMTENDCAGEIEKFRKLMK